MKLYYAPGTCALACWIALEWAGAKHEVEQADPRSESYRKINPLGMVPALDIGGSRPMTQADAILQYIAERYPDSDLGADTGLEARFEFNEIMSFLTGDFHPAFWPYFAPQRFTTDETEESLEAARTASYARVERVLDHLDNTIGRTGHVYRSKRTVADAYAFVMTRWSTNFPKSWREFPHLSHFMDSMHEDNVVTSVLARSQA
ncbi:glutathione S-transferase N-terminal domain-containing protein [Leisingera daeponensis]|uniref:Glutathione S-transferase N-terminal domain-containing protein n=1 Tax=Leisingera daeponensis TaxID=405746 RepID=A0ABS7NKW6_9RHOB|nr:glutathione S-transferase N-terminal domain-containing protein [Leisingera daeponensis]MBY6141830.1 glutathione S-transferase N-terminal domain-containing protein [Leisingera daeponensis]